MFKGAQDPNRIVLTGLLHPGDRVYFSCPLGKEVPDRRITMEGVGQNMTLFKPELAGLADKESLTVPKGKWSRLYPLDTPGYIIYFDTEDPIVTELSLLDTVLLHDLMEMRNIALAPRPKLMVFFKGREIFNKHIEIKPNRNGRMIEPRIVF